MWFSQGWWCPSARAFPSGAEAEGGDPAAGPDRAAGDGPDDGVRGGGAIASVQQPVYSASVLIVGWAEGMPALLLGGRYRAGFYRYGDFGGQLYQRERQCPHRGAFRELAEELFGLGGVAAQQWSTRAWAAVVQGNGVAGFPIQCGTHLVYAVESDTIASLLAVDCREGPQSSTIEYVASHFKAGEKVRSVALVALEDLLPLDSKAVDEQGVQASHGNCIPLGSYTKVAIHDCLGMALEACGEPLRAWAGGSGVRV